MNSETTSPRLSFSHDDVLPLKEDEYSREDTLLLESTSEFEFSISSSHEHKSSSADELFCNGVILPLQINCAHQQTYYDKLPSLRSSLPPRPCPPNVERTKKDQSFKEVTDVNSLHDQKSQSKSFWGFKRSKSLNCDSKRNMICPFPFLSRSKSTGSVPNPKRAASKDSQKHISYKQLVMTKSTSSSPSSSLASAANLYPSMQQKPPLNKSYGGSCSNGVRVSPFLNVPPPYISKGTANLLGFGSIFSCGKDKRGKNRNIPMF